VPHCPRNSAHFSTVRSTTSWADRSPPTGDDLTLAFRVASLVICHYLLNRFFRRISSSILAGKIDHGSALVRRLAADATVADLIGMVSLPTHLSIPFLLFTGRFPGRMTWSQAWNAAQSIRVKLGLSVTFAKYDRFVVSERKRRKCVVSAELTVTCTGKTKSLTTTLSRTSGSAYIV
jgi:hypothetical protein